MSGSAQHGRAKVARQASASDVHGMSSIDRSQSGAEFTECKAQTVGPGLAHRGLARWLVGPDPTLHFWRYLGMCSGRAFPMGWYL